MHGAHELIIIAFIAIAATLCGMLLVRLKQPAIIGYILAGMILGPSGLGLVQDRDSISLLAEMGVILLLYFIGMELSLRSFRHIWKIAVITALVQIGASLLVMQGMAKIFGWPDSYAILFGFCLALSSTAVAVKVLEGGNQLRSHVGRLAVGILVAQDLAVAPMMVITGNLSSGEFDSFVFIEVAMSILILCLLIFFLTRRKRVVLPFANILKTSSDLAPLVSLTWCLGIAAGMGMFGMSPAFGAFLAGLVVGNSAQRHEVHENAAPVQAVLLMIFFLSIGLLIDFQFFVDNLPMVLAMWAFVTIFKTLLNIGLLRLQGENVKNAVMTSLVLAQVGEFSFVLADVAKNADTIDHTIHKLIVAVTVVSLVTTPIFTNAQARIQSIGIDLGSFRGAMKLIYFREWNIVRVFSLMLWDVFYRFGHWVQRRMDHIKGRGPRWIEAAEEANSIPDAPGPEEMAHFGRVANDHFEDPKQKRHEERTEDPFGNESDVQDKSGRTGSHQMPRPLDD